MIDNYEDEIDAIRVKLYEETKGLTVEERVKRSSAITREMAAQYGFKIVKSARRVPKVAVKREQKHECAE